MRTASHHDITSAASRGGRSARSDRDVRHPKGGQRPGMTSRGLRRILTLMPDESPKRLIVVGDRVLITPEEGEERTNVGLYLPPTAVESRQVQGGRIVATGPGTPRSEEHTSELQ